MATSQGHYTSIRTIFGIFIAIPQAALDNPGGSPPLEPAPPSSSPDTSAVGSLGVSRKKRGLKLRPVAVPLKFTEDIKLLDAMDIVE